MKKIDISIGGMHCASCVKVSSRALKKVPESMRPSEEVTDTLPSVQN